MVALTSSFVLLAVFSVAAVNAAAVPVNDRNPQRPMSWTRPSFKDSGLAILPRAASTKPKPGHAKNAQVLPLPASVAAKSKQKAPVHAKAQAANASGSNKRHGKHVQGDHHRDHRKHSRRHTNRMFWEDPALIERPYAMESAPLVAPFSEIIEVNGVPERVIVEGPYEQLLSASHSSSETKIIEKIRHDRRAVLARDPNIYIGNSDGRLLDSTIISLGHDHDRDGQVDEVNPALSLSVDLNARDHDHDHRHHHHHHHDRSMREGAKNRHAARDVKKEAVEVEERD